MSNAPPPSSVALRLGGRAVRALAPAGLVLVILYGALGGWARDFHVPLQYSEDALEYLMQAQGTIQNGWWWTHPHLGAPGVFQEVSYPSNTDVEQGIVRVMSFVAKDPGLNLNLSWLVIAALASVVAAGCLRLLGISQPTSALAGVLYALVPYALSRNIHHFSLAIYLVPVPCVAALLVAAGRLLSRRVLATLTVGCTLVGFDYAYYAFFGVFLLLVATAIAAVRDRHARGWKHGVLLAMAIVVATAINLSPTFRVWQTSGVPLAIPDKTAAESEVYGLKIRQLISPVPDHPFAPFARWATLEHRAAFPLETENTTSRLGLLASIGFLGLLATLVVPTSRRWVHEPDLIFAAAGLTLSLVLLGTIGGFGSLFSLLISPAIRSYNRVCPFIAFFGWVGLATWLDRRMPGHWLWRIVVVFGLLVLGVWDQIGAMAPLNRTYAATETEWTTMGTFVHALEARLPRDAMVFQLPLTTYLNDDGLGQMGTYDEIKPYLASHSLRWSYPALDNAVVRWQHAVARLPPRAMARALRQAGFRAIVIDRAGYEDHAVALEAALMPPADTAPVLAEEPGYLALDLTQIPLTGPDQDGVAQLPRWSPAFDPASTGLPPCGFAITAHIDRVGPLKAPPSGPLTLERASSYTVRGWAVDDAHQAVAGDVDLVVAAADGEQAYALATFYGVNRPDVASRAGVPAYRYSGVLARLPAADLPVGLHRLAFRVVAADRSCASTAATLTVIVPPVF